ncbi:NAD-P-binding protein [Lentinus tigrinus ALCF2SS1-7]|uniref:NAD-P-binding protein n=1 Tax=Lentinus tigrinus ALCF2SS1-6 TaxID=1328759 RepID=A0A5C2RTR9_9APHY|nr:NAD-P-binding protein [Lentinus tigrinus ALCF2SS1-6]RPD70558.1 NAD-P-binding protein [Lentinus tigrinus ALCF2SS1-7]
MRLWLNKPPVISQSAGQEPEVDTEYHHQPDIKHQILSKVILVIGGTGAQGLPVVDALLKPSADGSASPYAVRVLTRDPSSSRAQSLAKKGVEVVQGSVDDFASVLAALEGAYGAFVNTDSFTLGEQKEIFIGMRIFELAKQIGTLQHYVWSGLDYSFKKGGYNPIYRCTHHDGKARVGDWMRAQPSIVSDDNMSWSILTTMVYMEMLNIPMMGPLNKRADGTYVFAAPIGNGHVPFVTLADVGFFARHVFDNRAATSARELEIASDWVDWPHLVSTFTNVTGKPAVYRPLAQDEWFALFEQDDINRPLANEKKVADGSTTWRENFSCWWAQYRDDVIKRDWEWIRRVNPHGHTLESWMRETGYTGDIRTDLLKNMQDGKSPRLNLERISRL